MARAAEVVAVALLLCLGTALGAGPDPASPAKAAPPAPEPPVVLPKNVTRTDSRPIPKNVTLDAGEKPSTMLSSSSKGVGASCVPSSDSYYGPGSGCSESEACCPTTNTCFDRSGGCAAFAARCAPADCGKDMDFKDTECAADVTKYFKKGGVKCSASSDTVCFANATAMALRCSTTSGSAAAAPRMLASLAAAVLALALFMH